MQKPTTHSARYVAIEILEQLFTRHQPVKALLDRSYKKNQFSTRDRGLVMQLVYGVLRKRQTLDRAIELLSSTPLKKLDPFIHQCLAVGLYQILFLTRIPESAAVNEMVNCCKVAGKPKRLHAFVNGNLRNAIRRRKELKKKILSTRNQTPILNHPTWLASRWTDNFGKEVAGGICASNNLKPKLTLRVNTTRISVEEMLELLTERSLSATAGTYAPEAVVLQEFQGSVHTLPGYNGGYFQVQDEATQLAAYLMTPFKEGGRYLDVCAGLGGKTSHLVQLGWEKNLEIHAVEPHHGRQKKLVENLGRLFDNPRVTVHAGTLQEVVSTLPADFDGILLDAPCSGTGVIRRHPDIKWNRCEEQLEEFSALQRELLQISSRLLAPGGSLVYATCSLEPEENIQVIQQFLAENRGFTVENCADRLPASCNNLVKGRCFHPLPTQGLDGFFGCCLTKEG